MLVGVALLPSASLLASLPCLLPALLPSFLFPSLCGFVCICALNMNLRMLRGNQRNCFSKTVFWGPAWWHSMLIFCPMEDVTLASYRGATSCPGCSTSDLALCYGLVKQERMEQDLGPLHLHGRSRRGSWFLPSDWLSSSCCSQERERIGGWNISLPLLSL